MSVVRAGIEFTICRDKSGKVRSSEAVFSAFAREELTRTNVVVLSAISVDTLLALALSFDHPGRCALKWFRTVTWKSGGIKTSSKIKSLKFFSNWERNHKIRIYIYCVLQGKARARGLFFAMAMNTFTFGESLPCSRVTSGFSILNLIHTVH